MARTNPGGSADYTLRSIDGASLSLSDLTRSNPQNPITVEIVMAGMGGVRSNPSGVPIPTDFTSSPSFARGGNFTSTLLPENLDPQLVERMVAQEGLFGAMQTLTILLSERSPMESMSPTTAGLLYAHSAIPRSNPSVKTPFLADVPKEMIDSDIRITRYLHEKGVVDDDTISTASGMIDSAKVTAKYGLTRRQLDTFVDDVLAPFMAVAPANRGALRHINKKLPSLKSGKGKKNYSEAYTKLIELMPTKAEHFYHGRDYGLIASPHCVYPLLCEKIIPPKVAEGLLKVAKEYPNNLVMSKGQRVPGELKMTIGMKKFIKNKVPLPTWKQRLMQIFRPGSGKAFEAKRDLLKGSKKDDESYMDLIVEALHMKGNIDIMKPTTDPFVFTGNIGGFYPSPPKRWPQQVVYSVMDTLLMSLPDIIDLEGGGQNNYESRVYRLIHSKQDVLDGIFINNKAVKKEDIEKALTDDAKRKEIVEQLKIEFKDAVLNEKRLNDEPAEFLNFILTNCIIESKGIVDPKYGKSIFELLFETIETAQGKYNYKIADDDITFALILLDYSIKMLFDDGTMGSGGNTPSVTLGGLFGPRTTKKFSDQAKTIIKDAQGSITEAETNIIVLLGALSAFVDALYDETLTGDDKDANLVTLDNYMKTFEKKNYPYAIIQQGRGILLAGKRRLEEKLV
tara:strand:+ start:5695 stop:7734 length:2040 start_codon:yes stop_codon:yes gene_type:complete